jgi:hypothetical protein
MNSQKYTIPHTVMVQNVDDETLLFDSATELFFALNDTGAVMWESITEYNDLMDVYTELLEIFEVEPKQLEGDFGIFVSSLVEQGLIVLTR